MHSDTPKNARWKITNERHNASPLPGFLPLFVSMTRDIGKYINEDFELEALVEFSNRHVRMAAKPSQWEKAGLLTVDRLASSDFADWVVDGLAKETFSLNELGDYIRNIDCTKLTTQELSELFNRSINSLEKFIVFNNYINASDFYHEILSGRILACLRACINQDSIVTAEVAYSVLTTPDKTVWIQEEEIDLLNILSLIQENADLLSFVRSKNAKDFFENINIPLELAFQEHLRKYFWIKYEQEGDVTTREHFFKVIAQMVADGVDVRKELGNIKARREQSRKRFSEVQSSVNLTVEATHLLCVACKFTYWKLHLREVKVRFYCCMNNLMEEIAHRLRLDRYQVRHLTSDELTGALKGERDVDAAAIDRRIKYCVFHFIAGQATVYEGQNAIDLFSVVDDDYCPTEIVNGMCAFPGVVEGDVTQVLDVEKSDHFPRGNVLVAYMTDVGVVPAMKRASAIVTDVGGVTCHASIIAREFNIPCVIGTKFATKALLDGYRVEVNATEGIVTTLSKGKTSISNQGMFSDEPDDELICLACQIPTRRPNYSLDRYIRNFQQLSLENVIIAGGKGAALGELTRYGKPVPPGFVVLTSAFEEIFVGTEIGLHINKLIREIRDDRTLRKNSKEIQRLIVDLILPPYLANEIQSAFLCLDTKYVAVRSSAIHEDSGSASWAGQLESFLNTTYDDLLLNVCKCWASLFSHRAMLYRAHCGSVADYISAAVVVQAMVDSRVSGTAFSAHPVTGDTKLVFIESCIGLGETLVLGKETPSSFTVSKNRMQIISKELNRQKTAMRRSHNGAGNELYSLSDVNILTNTLTDVEALEVASLVVYIENKSGFPVDVEWAYSGDTLYLLQSRPITTIRDK